MYARSVRLMRLGRFVAFTLPVSLQTVRCAVRGITSEDVLIARAWYELIFSRGSVGAWHRDEVRVA